jgi:hypothetical protein
MNIKKSIAVIAFWSLFVAAKKNTEEAQRNTK